MATFLCSAFSLAAEKDREDQWATRAGGDKNDKARGICSDKEGSIFVTGGISSNGDFEDHNLESSGNLDFLLAKLDSHGKLIWAATARRRRGGSRLRGFS
ncbi:MAG: SBBP repeat-containing protein [Verrucomicrobiota bacterium]